VKQTSENLLNVRVRRFTLDEVTERLLLQLKPLYDSAYYNSPMHAKLVADIKKRPEIFHLFVAFIPEDSDETEAGNHVLGKIVGARAIESKEDPSVDYLGLTPVYRKHFVVLPSCRGNGVGKEIVARCHEYCFTDLDLKAVFGSSAEIGALAMYGREGALYSLETIRGYSHKNSPDENLAFFREFISNPLFRSYRLSGPGEKDIRFVYCRDKETGELLSANGYISKEELLKGQNS